jgi:hypothetical protein
MGSERPKYDPAELGEAGLTEEEAEGIRLAMEEIDRGETMSGASFFAQIDREIEALSKARKTG